MNKLKFFWTSPRTVVKYDSGTVQFFTTKSFCMFFTDQDDDEGSPVCNKHGAYAAFYLDPKRLI